MFKSVFIGGFEGSTHRRFDSRRVDSIAASGHDRHARTDYALLAGAGVRTMRDSFRWHLIEAAPGRYDWGSVLQQIRAARAAGVEVVWDLLHYGLPDHVDIWSPDFVSRFADFSTAAARLLRSEGIEAPRYTPINEISFWSWAGGDGAYFFPFGRGRGWDFKCQLIRAAVAGTRAVRAVDPRALILAVEPAINVLPETDTEQARKGADDEMEGMGQAWDMLLGRLCPELGGAPDMIDVIGLNYYFDNQWFWWGRPIGLGHPLWRPFSDIVLHVWWRYEKPILVSETSAEGAGGPAWLAHVTDEAMLAREAGADVRGICVYPVMDYPGWINDRHCPCGILACDGAWEGRTVREPMARAVARLTRRWEAGV